VSTRRDVVKALALAPVAAAFPWTRDDIERAAEHALRAEQAYQPVFFSPQEWRAIRVLVDDIIPRDSRSGSATDARVPEFVDFILNDGQQGPRTSMRNGLAWLDAESQRRFSKLYAACSAAERHLILDDIAWPARAPEQFRANATWFNSVRNLTASGFFSSRVGLRDLNYTGNVALPRWTGAPQALMDKLGLSYDEWDRKYGRGF
jgi:gluconate 2-dehydrogenase gamma chain